MKLLQSGIAIGLFYLFRVKGALKIQPDFSSVLQNLRQFFYRLSNDPPGRVAQAVPQKVEAKPVKPVQLEFNAPRTIASCKEPTAPAKGKAQGKSSKFRSVVCQGPMIMGIFGVTVAGRG